MIDSYFSGIASNFVRADGKLNEFVTVGGSGRQITADDVKSWSTDNLWKTALGKARVRTRKADCRKMNKDAGIPSRPLLEIEPTNLDMNQFDDIGNNENSDRFDEETQALMEFYRTSENSFKFD